MKGEMGFSIELGDQKKEKKKKKTPGKGRKLWRTPRGRELWMWSEGNRLSQKKKKNRIKSDRCRFSRDQERATKREQSKLTGRSQIEEKRISPYHHHHHPSSPTPQSTAQTSASTPETHRAPSAAHKSPSPHRGRGR